MAKIDLTKEYKSYYTVKTAPQILEFGAANFLTVAGQGEPAGNKFSAAVQALYALAYGVKNLFKKDGKDFAKE